MLESNQRLAVIDRGLDLRANPAWCAVRELNPHLLGVGQLFWSVELPARKIGRGYRSRTCLAALIWRRSGYQPLLLPEAPPWWLAMDSNHPRRLYESRVLPTELASRVFPRKLAGRAGFEPAHGVINSHVPFQLGYRPKNIGKKQKAPTFVGASEIESELGNLANDQTNPEGRARLTRRLIMDLVSIVIFEIEYSMLPAVC